MHIEPNAWILTLPLTMALIQVQYLPEDHQVRQWWRQMKEIESNGWERLGWRSPSLLFERPTVQRVLFAALLTAMAAATLVSMVADAGFTGAG